MSSNIIRIVICAEDSFSLICGFLRPFHPWIPSLNSIFVIVQSLSHVWFFMTPWTAAHQGPLFSTISKNLLKLMSIESVMISNHVILCCPLLLLPSIFPSIRVFSNDLALCIRWPKYWSFSISSSNEYSGLISFRTDWFDLLTISGTPKSHYNLKALLGVP